MYSDDDMRSLADRGYTCPSCGALCGSYCYDCAEEEEERRIEESKLPDQIEFQPDDKLPSWGG